MKEVYINRAAAFLPNKVVENNEMEDFLGFVNGKPSRSRAIVLRKNGIKKRYYALSKGGESTHSNAEMTALAARNLFKDNIDGLKRVDLLCCGTSTPDQIIPSHAVMVHGHLPETNNIEVVSPSGACCSGMHAFKYAYMSVKIGEKQKAIATGSERAASMMTRNKFDEEVSVAEKIEENPYLAFEKDFLRWMLSDGAGAFLVESKKNTEGISLRIDWVEACSYANEVETCMYSAANKLPSGELQSYKDYNTQDLASQSIMSMKQDVKLLSKNIIRLGFDHLKKILEKREKSVDELTYFLPHLSSFFFEKPIAEILEENQMAIPKEKWFTNLATKGNVGSGSIYLMVEELMNSDKLKKGDQILLAVPESARFSYVFTWLTVC
ncbi:beta-ketoacyl-ACP synthase III [Aureispira anguillae]|uniref:Beta-ketoacyl-ACP synthase III n=1 Tax=Aureispira anguillae TaxID=2864201 RepID=A0A915YIS9_9BACT|nr:beta-ketoacyl-ACP synthase III [Aureispira anguillae]BDS13982.1 beta-ketoacyl-ACP synthase III [Aureispira anguillae]